MNAATLAGLSPEQMRTFKSEGCLVIDDVFSDAELQPLIDEISAEVDRRARELVEAGKLSRTYEEHGFETRLTRINRETDELARAIWNGSLHLPAIFDLIRHPRLLDIAESLCGPEMIASLDWKHLPKLT